MQVKNLSVQDDVAINDDQQDVVAETSVTSNAIGPGSVSTGSQTKNPNGSVSIFDSTGNLLETDFADDSRRIVNGPGSTYTATFVDADGSFIRYETDLEGGRAFYAANGRPLEFDFADGSSVVMFAPDGSSVQTNVDGTTLCYVLDGTIVVRNPSGVVVQVYAPDHSWKSVTDDGWKYYSKIGIFQGSETDTPDGIARFYDNSGFLYEVKYADGSCTKNNQDGSFSNYSVNGKLTETDLVDGTKRMVLPLGQDYTATWLAADGTFIKNEADLTGGQAYYGANAKPIEFDYAVGGSVVLFANDGSATQTNRDGSEIFYRLDGTATVVDRTGAVTQIYATDHSWKSPIPGGWAFYSASGTYLGKDIDTADGSTDHYDAVGRLTASDDAGGAKTYYGTDGAVIRSDASGVVFETDSADGSRRVLDRPTGRTLYYDRDGKLTGTDYPDGTRRIVSAPGSQFAATWLSSDGSFLRFEADLSSGTAFYDAQGKPLEFDFAVGGSVVKFNQDGSSLQTNSDGTTLAYALNGTVTVDDPSGRTVQVYAADHSWKSVTSDGWDYYSATQVFLGSEIDRSNGDKQLYDAAGRLSETDFADGTKSTYSADGNTERRDPSGTLLEIDFLDGSKQVFQQGTGCISCYDATGRLNKLVDSDGTTREYGRDGTVTIYASSGQLVECDLPDGTKQVVSTDGTVSFYDDEGQLTEVNDPCGSRTIYADGITSSYDASGLLEKITSVEQMGATGVGSQLATLQRFIALAESKGLLEPATQPRGPTIDARADSTTLATPLISGTAQAGSNIALYDIGLDGVQLVGKVTVDMSGHWALQPSTALQAGSNLLSAVQITPDGTLSASTSTHLTAAVGAPPTPSITETALISDGRGLVSVQGHGQPGQQIELAYATDSGESLVGHSPVDAFGNWNVEIPQDALPFGNTQLFARALDAAGNFSSWSSSTDVAVADPEATAGHVGQNLAEKLITDAAQGLDATADLQKLADEAPGGPQTVLDLPAGTYVLSHTVYLKSGSIIDSPGTTFVAGKDWRLAAAGTVEDATIHYAMFSNANWLGSGTLDTGIEFRNVNFDWRGTDSPGAAAVRVLNSQNVLVADCTFTGSNSGTAFEADDGAVVKNSISYATSEYGFDNWYGPKHTVIENNTVYSGSFGGISLTASPTSATGAAQAADNAVIGNSIYGFDRVGIDVNTLDEESSETNTLIANNFVSGTGRGIGVIGPTWNTLIEGNKVLGSNLQAIDVQNIDVSSGDQEAHNVEVAGNSTGALNMRPSAVAAIIVQADGGSVVRNTVDGGTYPTAFWLPSDNLLVANNASGLNVPQIATWWSSVLSIESMTTLDGSKFIQEATSSGPSRLNFIAQEGQGLVVRVPNIPGATFTATSPTPVVTSVTQVSAARSIAGDGAAGQPGTLTVFGSGLNDTIILATANDNVYVGGSNETITSGGGNDTFYAGPSTMSANIDGGSGSSQLVLVPDDQPDVFVMGDGIKNIASVKLVISDAPVSVELNDIPFLQAYASDQGVSISAGGPDQTINMGQGHDIMTGWSGGSTTFSGNSLSFYGDIILNLKPTDVIDFTDMKPTAWWDVQADGKGGSYVMAYDGQFFSAVDTPVGLSRSQFFATDDSHHGLAIRMYS